MPTWTRRQLYHTCDHITYIEPLPRSSRNHTIPKTSNRSYKYLYLTQIIEAGASSWQASLEELIELIKSQCGSKENRPDLKNWVMVEFYLHIWYCLGTQQLDKTKIGELKEYINLKGDAIS